MDDYLDALNQVDEALDHSLHRIIAIRTLIRKRRAEAARGISLSQALLGESAPSPLIQQVNGFINDLVTTGAHLRRAEARILYEEGASMEEIAVIFGVTRQRISRILRGANGNGS